MVGKINQHLTSFWYDFNIWEQKAINVQVSNLQCIMTFQKWKMSCMTVHTCNSSIGEAMIGRSWVRVQPGLHISSWASLDYISKCVSKRKNRTY